MGNHESAIKKVNFDDIIMISLKNNYILIHVMEKEDEDLLIKGTLSINEEIEKMNSLLSSEKMNVTIVIYGKNTDDVSKVIGRYRQLNDMGFSNVYVYLGGLFEWLLLQEIYGNDEIKTNNICKKNILDYKPARSL
jgi:rhodanese-related sulfurtransferase